MLYESLLTVLVTLAAVVCGTAYACVRTIMSDPAIRDRVIATSVTTMMRLTLSNPTVLSLITVLVNWLQGSNSAVRQEARLNEKRDVLTIVFSFQGREYEYLVPYNTREARRGKRVLSCQDGREPVDIKHCPGIPVTITAEQLGVRELVFEDDDE